MRTHKHRDPQSTDRTRRWLHAHAWTSAATVAALAYAVVETAGYYHP